MTYNQRPENVMVTSVSKLEWQSTTNERKSKRQDLKVEQEISRKEMEVEQRK